MKTCQARGSSAQEYQAGPRPFILQHSPRLLGWQALCWALGPRMNQELSALKAFPRELDKQGTEGPPRESQYKAGEHRGEVWGSFLEEAASESGPKAKGRRCRVGAVPGGGASC